MNNETEQSEEFGASEKKSDRYYLYRLKIERAIELDVLDKTYIFPFEREIKCKKQIN